jgi:hypothetical protein
MAKIESYNVGWLMCDVGGGMADVGWRMWEVGCGKSDVEGRMWDVGFFQEKRFPFEHEVFRTIAHFNTPVSH